MNERIEEKKVLKLSNNLSGDGDGRDGEVTCKESDSGARDGGDGSGVGGGVIPYWLIKVPGRY